jgi:hypothetical protein
MFEIMCIAIAIGIYVLWLSTPSERVMSDQEKVRREAEVYKKALQEKWLSQQKEHGKRVEARQRERG